MQALKLLGCLAFAEKDPLEDYPKRRTMTGRALPLNNPEPKNAKLLQAAKASHPSLNPSIESIGPAKGAKCCVCKVKERRTQARILQHLCWLLVEGSRL